MNSCDFSSLKRLRAARRIAWKQCKSLTFNALSGSRRHLAHPLRVISRGEARFPLRMVDPTHRLSDQLMNQQYETVRESMLVPASVGAVWEVADNPRKLADEVPLLGRFSGPVRLKLGSRLSEVHTILGWPQQYKGSITAFDEFRRWAMASVPTTPGPAPLPHNVEYRFEKMGDHSLVSIQCDYLRGGLLRLPFVKWLVRHYMAATIRDLLKLIATRATCPK